MNSILDEFSIEGDRMKVMRKGGVMITRSNKFINILNPDDGDEIDIEDISYALAGIYRFGGHSRYTVAEHSIHVANKAPDNLKLMALMHDAHEAILGDTIRTIKMMNPEIYEYLEIKIDLFIAKCLALPIPTNEEKYIIKEIDNRMLVTEARVLFNNMYSNDRFIWPDLEPYKDVEINCFRSDLVETMFIRAYNELKVIE